MCLMYFISVKANKLNLNFCEPATNMISFKHETSKQTEQNSYLSQNC